MSIISLITNRNTLIAIASGAGLLTVGGIAYKVHKDHCHRELRSRVRKLFEGSSSYDQVLSSIRDINYPHAKTVDEKVDAEIDEVCRYVGWKSSATDDKIQQYVHLRQSALLPL